MKTLTLLNGETYEVVDAKAREQIEDMQSDLTVESITAETTEDNENSGYIFYTKGVAYSPFNETISEDNPNYSLLNANGLSIKTGKYVTADDDTTTETMNTFSIDNANNTISLINSVLTSGSTYSSLNKITIDNSANSITLSGSSGMAMLNTSYGLTFMGGGNSATYTSKGLSIAGQGTFSVTCYGGDSAFNEGNLLVPKGRIIAQGIQSNLTYPDNGAIYISNFKQDPSLTSNGWYYNENFSMTRMGATLTGNLWIGSVAYASVLSSSAANIMTLNTQRININVPTSILFRYNSGSSWLQLGKISTDQLNLSGEYQSIIINDKVAFRDSGVYFDKIDLKGGDSGNTAPVGPLTSFTTNWYIDKDGNASFNSITLNGTEVNADNYLLKTGDTLEGILKIGSENFTLVDGGTEYPQDFYIDNTGNGRFNNLYVGGEKSGVGLAISRFTENNKSKITFDIYAATPLGINESGQLDNNGE
jgi:hypothetical protein